MPFVAKTTLPGPFALARYIAASASCSTAAAVGALRPANGDVGGDDDQRRLAVVRLVRLGPHLGQELAAVAPLEPHRLRHSGGRERAVAAGRDQVLEAQERQLAAGAPERRQRGVVGEP